MAASGPADVIWGSPWSAWTSGSSSSSSSNAVGIVSVLLDMLSQLARPTEQQAMSWLPFALQQAAALEHCWRIGLLAVGPAAKAQLAGVCTLDTLSRSAGNTLTLVSCDRGDGERAGPLGTTLGCRCDAVGMQQLFSLLCSTHKQLKSGELQQSQLLDSGVAAIAPRMAGIAANFCIYALGNYRSSSGQAISSVNTTLQHCTSTNSSSSSTSSPVDLSVAPWLVLWARCIANMARQLAFRRSALAQAAAAVDEAARSAVVSDTGKEAVLRLMAQAAAAVSESAGPNDSEALFAGLRSVVGRNLGLATAVERSRQPVCGRHRCGNHPRADRSDSTS